MNSSATERDATLAAALTYTAIPPAFGTSGRRGDVVDLSQLEIYINVRADLDCLFSLPSAAGGIVPGQRFFYACNLRPSSTRRVAAQGGRGELAQTVASAIGDAGLVPVFLSAIPNPAAGRQGVCGWEANDGFLTASAVERGEIGRASCRERVCLAV